MKQDDSNISPEALFDHEAKLIKRVMNSVELLVTATRLGLTSQQLRSVIPRINVEHIVIVNNKKIKFDAEWVDAMAALSIEERIQLDWWPNRREDKDVKTRRLEAEEAAKKLQWIPTTAEYLTELIDMVLNENQLRSILPLVLRDMSYLQHWQIVTHEASKQAGMELKQWLLAGNFNPDFVRLNPANVQGRIQLHESPAGMLLVYNLLSAAPDAYLVARYLEIYLNTVRTHTNFDQVDMYLYHHELNVTRAGDNKAKLALLYQELDEFTETFIAEIPMFHEHLNDFCDTFGDKMKTPLDGFDIKQCITDTWWRHWPRVAAYFFSPLATETPNVKLH